METINSIFHFKSKTNNEIIFVIQITNLHNNYVY